MVQRPFSFAAAGLSDDARFDPIRRVDVDRDVLVTFTDRQSMDDVWNCLLLSLKDAALLPTHVESDVAERVHLVVDDRSTHLPTPLSGPRKWCAAYKQRTSTRMADLDAHIDAFMAEFDAREAKRVYDAKRKKEPDAEGWVTVVSKRAGQMKQRVPTLVEVGLTRAEDEEKSKTMTRGAKRKLKSMQQEAQLPFYKFEVKKTRLDRLQELRRKFDDDKKQVEIMKAARKFKPF